MRISDWSSDLCSSDLLHGVSPTAPSTLRVYQFRHSRRCPLAWPPARSGSYSVPAQKGNGKFGREFAHEFMDKTARQGLANSAGPGGVRRSSSGRLLTEPASRRHHGGARTFMRTAALVAFLVALLVGTLLAGIYLWWSLS